jgi:SAM-dependent methyltransferase
MAGYAADELGRLPKDAVVNSFGCGNPLAFVNVREGDVVVDLGSGAGIDLLLARERVGASGRVIGVDMTDEMIEQARRNVASASHDNVEVRKGLIEELPVDSASADWVISNCVINLSPEKAKVFAEIARVLKPGGRVSVSDIVVNKLPDEIRKDKRLYCSCVAGAISEEAYLDGLRNAGLTEVEVKERFVYDAAQLKAFFKSELPEGNKACCGGQRGNEELDRLAEAMVGKVWSAKVSARKAGGCCRSG